jgi:DNA topoisomerase I
MRQGDLPGQAQRRCHPALHPAAAALFRSEPGQAAGGARHRRPSTYASTIQTLRDRAYVRMEKNRFFAEDSGRLLTAFLERFFPAMSPMISPPAWRTSSTIVSGGREEQGCSPASGSDFKPKQRRGDGAQALGSDRGAGRFLSDFLFPRVRMAAIRAPARCASRRAPMAACPARRKVRGLHRLRELSGMCKYTRRNSASRGDGEGGSRMASMGQRPRNRSAGPAQDRPLRPLCPAGRGQGGQARLIPKDLDDFDLEWALKLLACRASSARIRRPGKDRSQYRALRPLPAARWQVRQADGTREVFETGMNARSRCWPRRPTEAAPRAARPSRSRCWARTLSAAGR